MDSRSSARSFAYAAVCICHPHPDGRFLLRCHIWSADPDAQAHTHVPGGLIRLEQIEQHILATGQVIHLLSPFRVQAMVQ